MPPTSPTFLDLARAGAGGLGVLAVLAGAAIAFGGPADPPPMERIAERVRAADLSAAPAPSWFRARDGADLPYRRYGPDGAGAGEGGPAEIVVALHGSGAGGIALHPLGAALAAAGRTVIVPDIRGHGDAGRRGDVDYLGQASDDLSDLIAHLRRGAPGAAITLMGFSMGGGLALRHAAARPDEAARLVLLSPYLAHDAPPNVAPSPHRGAQVWAEAGAARIVALSMLNRIGITAFDHLPVVAFAAAPESDAVTRTASWRLIGSTSAGDWAGALAGLAAPAAIVVGEADELHAAPAYGDIARDHAPDVAVLIAPLVDHMGLVLDAAGHDAVLSALAALDGDAS